MKNIKLLILFLMITSNFSFGQCEKKINDYIQMIKSISCADVNNSNSQAMMNLDRVGKELANSCAMSFVQRGEEIKKATMDKAKSCGSNINSNSQSNNQSNNNNYNSTNNTNSSSNSQNSSGSVGTSSMNRGGNIVTRNSNSQNSNNQQEELARQQQEKISLQQEKTNQEVEKANQEIAKAKERIYAQSRQEQIAEENRQNQVLLNTNNIINESVNNSIQKSKTNRVDNQKAIEVVQKEFSTFNLTEKEIDSLLTNSTSNDYATIYIYNMFKGGIGLKIHTFINGYKMPELRKNQKVEHRIYIGNKLTIQFYGSDFMNNISDLTTHTTRIRKGKTYYFAIKKSGVTAIIEELETPPSDEKEKIENLTLKVKSDIEY